MDDALTQKPCSWNIKSIRRFMIVYGLQSSVFDIALLVFLVNVFHVTPGVFRTAWFFESLLTEVVIIFIVRTKKNVFQSNPSITLILLCVIITAITLLIPFSAASTRLGFVSLPFTIIVLVLVITFLYGLTGELLKRRYLPL